MLLVIIAAMVLLVSRTRPNLGFAVVEWGDCADRRGRLAVFARGQLGPERDHRQRDIHTRQHAARGGGRPCRGSRAPDAGAVNAG